MRLIKKNRIVLFLGAGFAVPWDGPLSEELRMIVANHLAGTRFKFLTDDKNKSFEDILAAIYMQLAHSLNDLHQELFCNRVKEDTSILYGIYTRCISDIIKRVEQYENSYGKYNVPNKGLKDLFRYLSCRYKHISVYSTNYDEIVRLILGWSDKTLSLNPESTNALYGFNYSPLKHGRMRHSYTNLHGSIHLTLNGFDGAQKGTVYSLCATHYLVSHLSYGGNPSEPGLWFPIIVGHSKAQQILSKHFSYPIACFINDLSDCNTFLAIGSSFSDPHLNAIIRQYTHDRKVSFRIVTNYKCKVLANSAIDKRILEQVFVDHAPWTPDTKYSKYFIRSDGRLLYYKKGTKEFLTDKIYWKKYL